MKTIITKETLIRFGMKENTEGERMIFPMIKQLSEESEDGKKHHYNSGISLCVTNLRNQTELCLNLDGNILYINPSCIEDLEIFEKCIGTFEGTY